MKHLRMTAAVAAFCVLFSACFTASGETLREKVLSAGSNVAITSQTEAAESAIRYSEYAASYQDASGPAVDPVTVTPSAATFGAGVRLAEKTDADGEMLEWSAVSGSSVTYSFTVPADGVYRLAVDYYIPAGTGERAVRRFTVDGKAPFAECETLYFYPYYTDATAVRKNSSGDEISPTQKELPAWRTLAFCDGLGLYAEPYAIYFSAGVHTVTLYYVGVGLCLGDFSVSPAQTVPDYQAVLATWLQKGYTDADGVCLKVEAESEITEKNSSVIRRQNTTDPHCTPRNDSVEVLNILKGEYWKTGNETVSWKLSVPRSGFYTLGMTVKQSLMEGLPVYRKIEIDGEVPFAELLQYRFEYASGWQTVTLSDSTGAPYRFYLEQGEHTLSMTVKLSDNREIVYGVQDDMERISAFLNGVRKITGSDPDVNYEYHLDEKIPTLLSDLRKINAELSARQDAIRSISAKSSPAVNQFESISLDFEKIYKDPDKIPRMLDTVEDDLETLGGWSSELQSQPLAMDKIILASPDQKIEGEKVRFYDYILIAVKAFLRSFTGDYDVLGSVATDYKVDTTLDVWIGRGEEWAELLDEMAASEFTAKTGIGLNVNVIPSGQLSSGGLNTLMLSMAAGREPDVALGVSFDLPVEFSFRDGALELSKFDGFREVSERFLPGVREVFCWDGNCYGLPETMNLRFLIYRTDLLSGLGLSVPNTWEDVYANVLPVLYQNNLEFYYPSDFVGYSAFLYQLGGQYYNADGTASALDSDSAYKAFREWTELYTDQGIDISASFYNRFRNGIMPMGVATFMEYLQLLSGAPELQGKIGIAPLPGHRNADGVVDRTASGFADTGCMVFSRTAHPEEAFRFLSWWTSAEAQTAYGKSLEAIVGVSSRWGSANLEAFRAMSWKDAELTVIDECFRFVRERPIVPGGYYTTRHLTNAWNRVVLGAENPRDSLETAVADINAELKARRE